ncbi:MAG: hypothetical protein ACXWQO_02730 [Bdellovibrionota bacterium]
MALWLPTALLALAVAVALLIPLAPLLAGPHLKLLYRDIGSLVLLKRQIWTESVQQFGSLPLWNHWVLGGTPYLSDPASSVYFPLNAFFLFFPARLFLAAQSWYLLLQLGILFGSALTLFLSLRVPRAWAVLLAITIACAGTAFSYSYLPDYLCSLFSAIFFLAAWLRYCRQPSSRWLFISSLLLALPAYSSDPQTSFIFGIFFAPLCLHFYGVQSLGKKINSYLALGALALLAYSAQLIPSLDQLVGTIRDPRLGPMDDFEVWSLHPLRLLEWFSALPLGTEIYRGSALAPYTNGPNLEPLVQSLYPGLLFLPLLLATLRTAMSERKICVWYFLGTAFLLLAFGSYSAIPFNQWLGRLLPLWSSFRYPERLYIFGQLAFCLGIAQALAVDFPAVLKRLPYCLLFTLLVSVLFYLCKFPSAEVRTGALVSALMGALTLVTVFAQLRRTASASLWSAAMVAIVACDLALVTSRILFPVPGVAATVSYSPLARALSHNEEYLQKSSLPVRFYMSTENDLDWELLDRVGKGLRTQEKLTLHEFLNLQLNIGAFFHFPSPLGFSTTMNPMHKELWDRVASHDFFRLLGLKGTKYLGSAKHGQYAVSTLRDYLPYLWAPDEAWYSPNREFSLHVLESPAWPWTKRLIVQPNIQGLPGAFTPETVAPLKFHSEIISHSYSGVKIKLNVEKGSEKPAWILWNESFSPNWTARIDGKELPTAIGNAWAVALQIPALSADHEYSLELSYEDPLIALGRALFALWILLFLWAEHRYRQSDLRRTP